MFDANEGGAPPTVFVLSTLYNLQTMLEDWLGPSASVLLGATWRFDTFDETTPVLSEYDLPISWQSYATQLAEVSGLLLESHAVDDFQTAYDRLDLGQPVVLAVDSFYLPYRPAYLRVNSARTILATRIDRAASSVTISDPWMPAFTGELAMCDLDKARASEVRLEMEREPLFAGVPLRRRWWTMALLGTPLISQHRGCERALTALACQALGGSDTRSTANAIDLSRASLCRILTQTIEETRERRRAAALWLRAEIGLRAYLASLVRFAARIIGDTLLMIEAQQWAKHLDALSHARDLLIKSVVFEERRYAQLVDRQLAAAAHMEHKFLELLRSMFDLQPEGKITFRGRAP